MRYYVIGQDGQRYGPADVTTLNQWIHEGRLLPDFYLQPENSTAQVKATLIQGLNWPQHNFSPPAPISQPMQGYYARPQFDYTGGQRELSQAWTYGGIGLAALILGGMLCGACGAVGGIVLGFMGLSSANKARAAGSPNAQGAIVFNWVVIALSIAGVVLGGLFVGALLLGGLNPSF